MNRLAAIASLALAVIPAACSRTPPAASQVQAASDVEEIPHNDDGQAGRYQLVAAEHLIVGKKAIYNNKDLFRIDTITGKTEVLMSGDGRDFWSPIDEPGETPSQGALTAPTVGSVRIPTGFEIEKPPAPAAPKP